MTAIVYLSEADFRALLKTIDAPPAPNPRLIDLLRGKHITDSMASDDCLYPELW